MDEKIDKNTLVNYSLETFKPNIGRVNLTMLRKERFKIPAMVVQLEAI